MNQSFPQTTPELIEELTERFNRQVGQCTDIRAQVLVCLQWISALAAMMVTIAATLSGKRGDTQLESDAMQALHRTLAARFDVIPKRTALCDARTGQPLDPDFSENVIP